MLTAAQRAALVSYSQGAVSQIPGVATTAVQVQNYPGCNQGIAVGPTQESVPIDASQANQNQCGIFVLHIDRTATTISGTRKFTIGGYFAQVSDAALAREYGDFPSTTNFMFDEDNATEIGGNSANFSPLIFMPWLDLLVGDRHMIFSTLNAKDEGGTSATQTAFTTFSNQKLQKRSIQDQADWGVIAPNIEPNLCAPCVTGSASSYTAQWQGFMPVSGHDVLAIDIPINFKGTLEWCVYQYENARQMTICPQSI